METNCTSIEHSFEDTSMYFNVRLGVIGDDFGGRLNANLKSIDSQFHTSLKSIGNAVPSE